MNAKRIFTQSEEIPYEDPFKLYRTMTQDGSCVSLFMESKTRDLRYGRQSIIAIPSLQVTGRNGSFEMKALDGYGMRVLETLSEDSSLRRQSPIPAIRAILERFKSDDEHAGLYGAFGYDLVRQSESIGERFATEGAAPDFNLFLPSEVVVFDEIKEKAFRKKYALGRGGKVRNNRPVHNAAYSPFKVAGGGLEILLDMSDEEYMEKAARIVAEIKSGELIQAVLSRTVSVNLQQQPIESYARLRQINPSPYCFFFNFGEREALFGASPELHVRVSKGCVEIRPLAGTIRRTGNAVADYHARMQLLNDTKEQREHVMLVDLARNDIGRVCTGVEVTELMGVEEYPNLYHLGSGVVGRLRKGMGALDCIIATLPAGTLSGAPKVRAMQLIEELENSRRGYYGGCIGYVTFSGECNTGITIRSVYVNDGRAYVRAGAGIVHHSVPERELAEVNLKNENQIRVLTGGGAR